MDTNRYCRARLVDRVRFTDDLAVFRFEPEERLNFTPGQFATIAVEGDRQRPVRRPYSVASAPHEAVIEVFVERVDGGDFTPHLWDMAPGGAVWIRKKIAGLFVLDEDSGRDKHLMCGTVTGATPYVSMVRNQLHRMKTGQQDEPMEMFIIHGASQSRELGIYREEMLQHAEEHHWLTYVPTVSRPWEDVQWSGEVGRVEDILRKYMDGAGLTADNAVAYACGHPMMIKKVRAILGRAGFADEHIQEEKYFVEKATGPGTPERQVAAS